MKSKEQPNRILLTGFTSFPGVPVNPCVKIVQKIDRPNVSTCLLSVSYDESVHQLNEQIVRVQPDVIVELGVSSRAKHLKLERCAYNCCSATIPDVNGVFKHREPISETYELDTRIDSTMKVVSLFAQMKLQGDTEAELSIDPGRYVCNHLYFHTLTQHASIPTIFVHIPMLTVQNTKGVMDSLTVMLDCLTDPRLRY